MKSKLVSFILICASFFIITSNNNVDASEVLTQAEKEVLYNQYLEILEQVKSTVEWGDTLEGATLAPINEFNEADWVTPEVFEQRAISAIQAEFVDVPKPEISLFSTTSATRNKTITHSNSSVTISISATFTTGLSGGSQVFTGYSNLVTKSTTTGATFSRTGVTASILDRGRTYSFTIGGTVNFSGVVLSHTVSTDFNCSSTGVVS